MDLLQILSPAVYPQISLICIFVSVHNLSGNYSFFHGFRYGCDTHWISAAKCRQYHHGTILGNPIQNSLGGEWKKITFRFKEPLPRKSFFRGFFCERGFSKILFPYDFDKLVSSIPYCRERLIFNYSKFFAYEKSPRQCCRKHFSDRHLPSPGIGLKLSDMLKHFRLSV